MTKKKTTESGKKIANKDRLRAITESDTTGDSYIRGLNQGKLYVDPKEGYAQRWVNDQYGRIDQALRMGWRPRVDDGAPANLDTFDNCVRRIVNRDGLIAILMEIPQDVYDRNQSFKQKEVDDIEKSTGKDPHAKFDISHPKK